MRRKSVIGLATVAVVIAIQIIPVEHSNPPGQGELQAPSSVSDVLRRSCYNCHSNETEWPWYSYVAPISWILAHHVDEGRGKLNFSTWSTLSEKDRSKIVKEIVEEISEGNMPLRSYLVMHREAKLNDRDIEAVREWSRSLYEGNDSD